jgi:hypothetical protein
MPAHRFPARGLVAAALALAAVTLLALPALAKTPYLLHVKVAGSESRRGVDLAMPWDVNHGGSPFDFADDVDSPGMNRLRDAWTTLRRLPEGRTVTIEGEREDIRAWRDHGRLVLQPLKPDRDDDCLVLVPGEIVDALIRRDGRLQNADLAAILRRQDSVSLVEVRSSRGNVNVWIGRDED